MSVFLAIVIAAVFVTLAYRMRARRAVPERPSGSIRLPGDAEEVEAAFPGLSLREARRVVSLSEAPTLRTRTEALNAHGDVLRRYLGTRAERQAAYQRLQTTQRKLAVIAEEQDPEEVLLMWEAWEERGFSREGILYGRVLERLQELGVGLTPDEREHIQRARNPEGARMPAIRGRGRSA